MNTRIVRIDSLCTTLRSEMYRLYDSYYHNPGFESFEFDLNEKQFAILIDDDDGPLRGFTTLKAMTLDVEGRRVRGIFSGDTIIHHAHWGEQSLAFAWIKLAGKVWAEQKNSPLYWFLIVKGHRTYRYLNVFSKRFYPVWNKATPEFDQAVMNKFANQMFGKNYQPESGVIRFSDSRGHLKACWADVSDRERQRPEVGFFLKRNPGYTQGDELVCLTELVPSNLKPLARRLFLSTSRP